MNKFTTGLIAGGVLGAVGIGVYMSDSKNRRNLMKTSRKTLNKANDMIENVTDMF